MSDREKVINDLQRQIEELEERLAIVLEGQPETKPLRCKECSYHRNDGWCNEHGREVKESDYCSFGAWQGGEVGCLTGRR